MKQFKLLALLSLFFMVACFDDDPESEPINQNDLRAYLEGSWVAISAHGQAMGTDYYSKYDGYEDVCEENEIEMKKTYNSARLSSVKGSLKFEFDETSYYPVIKYDDNGNIICEIESWDEDRLEDSYYSNTNKYVKINDIWVWDQMQQNDVKHQFEIIDDNRVAFKILVRPEDGGSVSVYDHYVFVRE